MYVNTGAEAAAQDRDTGVLLCIYCIAGLFLSSGSDGICGKDKWIRVGEMNNQDNEHAMCGAAPGGNAPVSTMCGADPEGNAPVSIMCGAAPEGNAPGSIIACPLFRDTE